MCYQKDRNGGILLPEKLGNILKDLSITPKHITYMGGELSMFPYFTKQYITLGKQYFPYATSSLTTNGDGKLLFYRECINLGLSGLTFSIHEEDPELEYKILTLLKDNISVRVNCFLDLEKMSNALYVFGFCLKNKIPLTFCSDLRVKNKMNFMQLGELLNIYKPHYFDMEKSHAVCKILDTGFEFWVFWSSDYEDLPNTIILPSGRITKSFQEVLDGKD
jgi:hypothetical protein